MIMLTGKAASGKFRSRRNIRYGSIAILVEHSLQPRNREVIDLLPERRGAPMSNRHWGFSFSLS